MSLVRFKGSNHPQQVAARGAAEDIDDRATIGEVFDPLHDEFGFTVDVAAAEHNTKCLRFYDKATNGLAQDWSGERVWCNPPYSSIEPWVEKAWHSGADVVVMLLPANRTEQGWWHRWVEPYRDRPGSALSSRFLKDRIRFMRPGVTNVGPNERPPFGCVLLVWRGTGELQPDPPLRLDLAAPSLLKEPDE